MPLPPSRPTSRHLTFMTLITLSHQRPCLRLHHNKNTAIITTSSSFLDHYCRFRLFVSVRSTSPLRPGFSQLAPPPRSYRISTTSFCPSQLLPSTKSHLVCRRRALVTSYCHVLPTSLDSPLQILPHRDCLHRHHIGTSVELSASSRSPLMSQTHSLYCKSSGHLDSLAISVAQPKLPTFTLAAITTLGSPLPL